MQTHNFMGHFHVTDGIIRDKAKSYTWIFNKNSDLELMAQVACSPNTKSNIESQFSPAGLYC